MKIPILILTFFAVTSAIDAQNPRKQNVGEVSNLADVKRIDTIKRIDTYKYTKGGDSIRFTIVGKNDTVQRTELYLNGKIESMTWKRDSSYHFDELGRLKIIAYDLDNKISDKDNVCTFYANGQLYERKTAKNGVCLEQNFNEKGEPILTTHFIEGKKYHYEQTTDRKGVPIKSHRVDTLANGNEALFMRYDTVFHDNKRPFKTSIFSKDQTSLGVQYYDASGKLIQSSPPDSLGLIVFKDNVDCYYGLKNKRGDTIVKPRFDRFDVFKNLFWLAYTGEKVMLLSPNGAPSSLSFSDLTDMREIYPTNLFDYDNYKANVDVYEREITKQDLTRYFAFTDANNHGIMTDKGAIVMPPQSIWPSGRYIGNAQYFEFKEKEKDTLRRVGFLNRQGKPIFSDCFKGVLYLYYDDYFFLSLPPFQRYEGCNGEQGWQRDRVLGSDRRYTEGGFNTLGIGKGDGKIVLDAQFSWIKHIDSSLFMVSVDKTKDTSNLLTFADGLYDAHAKRWLLDTTTFQIMNKDSRYFAYFIVKHTKTKKYGMLDTKGRNILPLKYDAILDNYGAEGLFVLKMGNKYQVANLENGKIIVRKPQYDFLSPVKYEVNRPVATDYVYHFVARRNNKWGLIDAQSKTVKPFDYDYASLSSSYQPNVILVKNNQAECYDLSSFPNEMTMFPNFSYTPNPKEVRSFNLLDSNSLVFFINNTGKVVISPQYKKLYIEDNYGIEFLEDAQKQKKLLFMEDGKLIDFPFPYRIDWISPKSAVAFVQDTAWQSHGVVSTDGKQLVPCNNYAVALGDIETSTFFVKHDTPLIKRTYDPLMGFERITINDDSLNIEDAGWQMYDKNGRLVSDKPFRFPIDFEEGIGVGMKDNAFGLYRTDGSVLTIGGVQDFKNIRRGKGRHGGSYVLYYNQGLTPRVVLTTLSGNILVESGRYDELSRFFGKYALVSKAGKIGLIDTIGKEIIAPQDLMSYAQQFTDSLDLDNKSEAKRRSNRRIGWSNDQIVQPINFDYLNNKWHPDSLDISPPQRAALWNLMLQKSLDLTLETAQDVVIQRTRIKKQDYFLNLSSSYRFDTYKSPRRITVSDSTIAFNLLQYDNTYQSKSDFYNFYRKNGRWEELKINDLLQVQGDKRWLLNDLMTKKIKALKDQSIDCSNAEAFITTVENRWMLTKTGIDFCFDSTSDRSDFVVISFTWAELGAFLKMKIY